jgi:hypothetical protein
MLPKRKIRFYARSFLLGSLWPLVLVALLDSSAPRLVVLTAAPKQSLDPAAPEMIQEKGPWGVIQALGLPLADADGELPDQSERLQKPRWVFDHFSADALTAFLNTCDLSSAQRSVLLDRKFWTITASSCVVSPPEEIVLALNSRCREQIYSVLARSPANYPQRFPFRFPLNGFAARLQGGGLAAADVAQLKRLSYIDAGTVCFSDLDLAEHLISPGQFKNLVGTIYEIPVYRLSLQITPDSNVDALAGYWGKGSREGLVKPLLTALTKVPEGTGINISFLLPPFARLRLYTYPDSWHNPEMADEDCTFSSMNFFNENPDTNFFNPDYTARTIHSTYIPIRGQPTFGDVIAIMGTNEKVIHMCVYIAGDFVFTKNGVNPEAPWVFMQLPDVYLAYCKPANSTHVEIFRRKELAPGPPGPGGGPTATVRQFPQLAVGQ